MTQHYRDKHHYALIRGDRGQREQDQRKQQRHESDQQRQILSDRDRFHKVKERLVNLNERLQRDSSSHDNLREPVALAHDKAKDHKQYNIYVTYKRIMAYVLEDESADYIFRGGWRRSRTDETDYDTGVDILNALCDKLIEDGKLTRIEKRQMIREFKRETKKPPLSK